MEENKQEENNTQEQQQQQEELQNQQQTQETQQTQQTQETQEQQQEQQQQEEEKKEDQSLTQPQTQQNKKNNDEFHLDEYFEDDGFPINVAVTDPSIKDGVSKYIMYCIKGEDKQGVFEVFRRYSDFYALRQALCQRWPGVYIPPIPPKKATGNFDAFFISERRQLFEIFLVEISKLKFLWYEQEFQAFLRTPADIEKVLSSLPKFYYEDTINKFQNVFRSLQGKILSQELDEKIQSFTLFLKKIRDPLVKFKDQMKILMNSRQLYDTEFDKFISFLLPQYELTCLKEYVGNIVEGKFVFAEQSEAKINNLLQELRYMAFGSKLKDLYISIKQEIYEIDAFIEAIGYIAIYEGHKKTEESKIKSYEKELAKAESGKKSLFSNKSSEQKVQEQNMKIEFHTGMLDKVNQILDLMKVITGYITVEKFKSDKIKGYYKNLQAVAQFEYDFSKKKADLWSFVLENDNLTSFEIPK